MIEAGGAGGAAGVLMNSIFGEDIVNNQNQQKQSIHKNQGELNSYKEEIKWKKKKFQAFNTRQVQLNNVSKKKKQSNIVFIT